MFFLIPKEDSKDSEAPLKWDENFGGNKIYTDDLTGKQLINLVPQENSLAIVVRDESISSHISYMSKTHPEQQEKEQENSQTSPRTFYCYDFEFSFPRTIPVHI